MPKRDRSDSLSPSVTDFLAELAYANRSRTLPRLRHGSRPVLSLLSWSRRWHHRRGDPQL